MIFLCYGGYEGTGGEELVSVWRGEIDTAIVQFVESQSRARFAIGRKEMRKLKERYL